MAPGNYFNVWRACTVDTGTSTPNCSAFYEDPVFVLCSKNLGQCGSLTGPPPTQQAPPIPFYTQGLDASSQSCPVTSKACVIQGQTQHWTVRPYLNISDSPGMATVVTAVTSPTWAVPFSGGLYVNPPSYQSRFGFDLNPTATTPPQRYQLETNACVTPQGGTRTCGLSQYDLSVLCSLNLNQCGSLAGTPTAPPYPVQNFLANHVMSYSPRNLLASLDGVNFTYDGFGQKVVANGSGRKAISLYDEHQHLIAETGINSTAIAHEYIWLGNTPVAQEDVGGTTHWTATDYRGAPIVQTGSTGAVYWRVTLGLWGSVTAISTSDHHQPLRQPGQEAIELDDGAGPNGDTIAYYNNARWYLPKFGVYTQPDPAGLVWSSKYNPYNYALNDPADYSDSSGNIVPIVIALIVEAPEIAAAAALMGAGALAIGTEILHQFDHNNGGAAADSPADAGSSYQNRCAEAGAKYPNKAGKTESHHIFPKYMGGDPAGPTVDIDAAYHQEITNEFRDQWGYGQGVPSPAEAQGIMNEVYSKFPLP